MGQGCCIKQTQTFSPRWYVSWQGGQIIDKTTFSPLTIERLRYYLICRKQDRIIRGEQLDEEWQCFLPPAWRRERDWQFSPRSPGRVRWNVEHMMRPGPLSPTVLATLREAERWELSLTDPPSPNLLIAQQICWATISDEATRLIRRAEETLSEEELLSLRQKADSQQGDLWLRYRARPSQVRALIERSLPL